MNETSPNPLRRAMGEPGVAAFGAAHAAAPDVLASPLGAGGAAAVPKALADYDGRDWRRLRPLTHAYARLLVDVVTEAYVRRGPRAGDLGVLAALIAGRQAMITVAFNDPEILGRQIRAVRTFTPGPAHLIADNSSDDASALEIAAICARLGAPYLRLPPNPWGSGSPSRSHGLALNWIWRRLIAPARPTAFGFLDHDILPLAPDDPFAQLARQPVAGDKRWMGERWFLWAGYSFFRTDILEALPAVDFGQDWSLGLDTGGGNWRALYSQLDPASIGERPIEQTKVFEDRPIWDCYYERRGAWLHEVGLHGLPQLRTAKRAAVLALVDAALANAAAARPANPAGAAELAGVESG